MRSIRKNKEIVPVTSQARAQYMFGQLAPGPVRFAAARGRLVR
ncbi:hypothetical protein [Nocardia sp. NPDC050412]